MGSGNLVEKLSNLKSPIRKWNREVFGIIDHRINTLESEIARMENLIGQFGVEEVSISRLNALKG